MTNARSNDFIPEKTVMGNLGITEEDLADGKVEWMRWVIE